MLKCETNTPKMRDKVRIAAKKALRRQTISADFEHGQWWITDITRGAQWSVCDAEGSKENGVFNGFCFEQVSKDEA